MGYDEFITLFYVAMAICLVMFVVSVVLFFKLRIIAVIGDLSGSTAKKAIETMRERNQASGVKAHKPSHVNQARGKVTDKMSASGRVKEMSAKLIINTGTSKIHTAELIGNETTVLADSQETTVLAQETTVLADSQETTVLAYEGAEVLSSNSDNLPKNVSVNVSDVFDVEDDIVFTHTNEKID